MSREPSEQERNDADAAWSAAVRGLASRVLRHQHPDSLRLRHSPEPGRSFSYEASAGVLTITASDASSACVGLHRYLREHCGVAIHWDTLLPVALAEFPDAPLTRARSRSAEQYMFNFCTFGYTMAHWGWEEWEREIDWMALHGITMPLAATGHEAVVMDALMAHGLSQEDAIGFLSAPVYLPFTFMGNLDGVIGGLSREWIEDRAALGRRILDRERELGMTPVLPAFTGHVPRGLAPEAVTPRPWQGFETFVLDPDDPRFAELGTAVTRAQLARFGTDHRYAADPFIEMIPVDDDTDYPGRVARGILNGLTAADPEAVWVLQSWPFSYQAGFWTRERVRAFLESIPVERLLVLDLWAEQDPQWEHLQGFFGRDWLWCGLLNFGGRSDPVADLQAAIDKSRQALTGPAAACGTGLSMEATRNNPVFFELLADLAWHDVPSLREWTARFAAERYGRTGLTTALQAWEALLDTVYSPSGRRIFPEDFHGILTRRPGSALMGDPIRLRQEVASQLWYEPARLLEAFELFIRTAEIDPALAEGPLGHDLVDTAIVFFSRLIDALGVQLAQQHAAGLLDPATSRRFRSAFGDLDRLLACRPEFRMSSWEAQAGAAAHHADAGKLLTAARQILTTWNDRPSQELDDYAARIWHGLVGDYYLPRWEAWLRQLQDPHPDPKRLEQELDRLSLRVRSDGVAEQAGAWQALAGIAREALDAHGPVFLEVVQQHPPRHTLGTGAGT